MVVRRTVVSHLENLRKFLQDLDRYRQRISREEFFRDRDKQAMVLFALLEAIQLCIDLGSHVISEKGWRKPETYRDVFRVLSENNLIDEPLRDQLQHLAGFRNIIVRLYGKLDLDKVYELFRSDHEAITRFAKVVEGLLEDESGDGGGGVTIPKSYNPACITC
jgi:uncharacterized protein YutE (UPF0331/DUF86 family)